MRPALLQLHIDPNLPEQDKLASLVEQGLKNTIEITRATAPPPEKVTVEASVKKTLEHLTYITSSPPTAPAENSATEKLLHRESQLKAIVDIYKKELQHWDLVKEAADEESLGPEVLAENVPPRDANKVPEAEDVLASSTKAVESYILQTDHARRTLMQLESKYRKTEARVRDVAASVNNRVLAQFPKSDGLGRVPPQGLKTVKTKDLNVSALTGDS